MVLQPRRSPFFLSGRCRIYKGLFQPVWTQKTFSHYTEALNMIIDPDAPESDDLEDQRFLDIY